MHSLVRIVIADLCSVRLGIICILNRKPRSHSDVLHSVRLLWMSDQPDAETSTWQHTKLQKTGIHAPWQDTNPQSQKASGPQGCREKVRAPVKKIFGSPGQGGPAKNLYTQSARLNLSCRINCLSSERFNLYSRQMIILPRKTKTFATHLGSPFWTARPGLCNLYRHWRPLLTTFLERTATGSGYIPTHMLKTTYLKTTHYAFGCTHGLEETKVTYNWRNVG